MKKREEKDGEEEKRDKEEEDKKEEEEEDKEEREEPEAEATHPDLLEDADAPEKGGDGAGPSGDDGEGDRL